MPASPCSTQPLRVAILADFPLSSLTGEAMGRGGGQGCTWLPQLALAFQDFPDLEIHWVILDRTIYRRQVIAALGQHFHRVPAVKFSIDLALNYIPARYMLGREIRSIQPDVVHAWGAELLYPCALQDFIGPTIFSMQGSLTYYQEIGGLPNDWRWRKMVASERGYVHTATVVTAESKWASERVHDLNPNADCRVVDYGVHPKFYQSGWAPDPKQPAALYIGGGDYRKGVDVLFESLRLQPDRKWTVRFAGGHELRDQVAAANLPETEYLGMLKWDDMIREMSRAWCLVIPTRADTGPTVVKEARVIGMPVIGTVHGGLRDYIRDGVNGRIVDPITAENLAAALTDVMSSHERVFTLGHGRHAEDQAYFHPSRTAEGFAEIYRTVGSGGPAAP